MYTRTKPRCLEVRVPRFFIAFMSEVPFKNAASAFVEHQKKAIE